MKKIKVCALGVIVLMLLMCGRIITVSAAGDFSTMSDQEFIRYLASNPISLLPFSDPNFDTRYQEIRNVKFGAEYPWASTTDAEFEYLRAYHMIDYGKAGDAYYQRVNRYNTENGVFEQWQKQRDDAFNAMLERKNKKMWENSALKGDANSHGALTNKDESVYSRNESGRTVNGVDLSGGSVTSEEPSGVSKIIMEFLCWLIFTLADQLDSILETGGIALDNVIFGRVAGYGVRPAGETEYITMFGFELTNGNPYGYVAAILFQRIRSYIYIFMAVFCLFKLVRIAVRGDYAKMKMDFVTFAQNALLSFSFVVMMPYMLDIYLYIRDVLLKAVTYGTLQDMFGTTGFLSSFRKGAQDAGLNLIPNIIYLGAVILSLVVAGIYIAYAMSMMVHFILFPFVCLRGIEDRNAYKEWTMETLGLTIMPLIDGMLLIVPLTFSDMANGNLAFNLLSLVSCGMLLTARRQAKRTLGIRDNGGLDTGAIATVMGLGYLARGIGKTITKTAKRLGAAGGLMKEAKEDANMADMYEKEAAAERVVAPNMKGGVPANESVSGISPGGFGSENLAAHANVNNFESEPFRRNLDNATMAQMYRKRAIKRGIGAFGQAAGAIGSGVGGLGGAAVGAGSGAFLGSGLQSFAIGTGMDAGSSVGGFVGEKSALGAGWLLQKYAELNNNDSISFGKKRAGSIEQENLSGDVDLSNLPVSVDPTGGAGELMKSAGEKIEDERLTHLKVFLGGTAGKQYATSFSNASSKVETPGFLENDAEFSKVINDVDTQLGSLLERARKGEGQDKLLNGAGGLNEIRNGFGSAKLDKLQKEIRINLTETGAPFSEGNQTHRDAMGLMMYGAGRSDSRLRTNGRLMTAEFDKRLGIDWDKTERLIRQECARYGRNE